MRLKPSMHKHTGGRSYKCPYLVLWLVEESYLSCNVALVTSASVIRGAGIGP